MTDKIEETGLKLHIHEGDCESGDGGNESEEGLRWLISYSSMITLLLVFFVIMFAISDTNSKKMGLLLASISSGFNTADESTVPPVMPSTTIKEAATGEDHKALRKLLSELNLKYSNELGYGVVDIERSNKGLVMRIGNTTLFELGKAALKEESYEVLNEVADTLNATPNRISVEGHTDSIPINTREFPSNWELSTKRAVNVLRYLVDEGGVNPYRISASGFGEFRPIVTNDLVHGSPTNRRVAIVILNAENDY